MSISDSFNSTAQAIINEVHKMIDPVYLVGGSLRDLLLGRDSHDYDFSTPLLPEEVESSVRNCGLKPYLVGKRFGTVGCKIEGHMIEITTFRGEIYAPGDRKPEVTFSATIEEDLARRDFTINALALTPEGKLIDLFDGSGDLKQGVIRTVGEASERFIEDPLRMLRAARFASQLSFSIEDATFEAMLKYAPRLMTVSHQRWNDEMDALLLGEDALSGLFYLYDSGLLNLMIPELALEREHAFDDFEIWLSDCKKKGSKSSIEDRWAALLRNVADPFVRADVTGEAYISAKDLASIKSFIRSGLIEKIGTYLHWSKKRTQHVIELAGGQPSY